MSSGDDIDILGKVKVEDHGSDTLAKVNSLTERLKDTFGGLADVVKNALGFALGNVLTGALEGIFGSFGELASGAFDAQKIVAQLNAVIESTGGVAGMTVDSVLALSDSLAQTTLFADDAITEAQNLLLTFTNIGSEVFPQATETLLDMAAAMDTDAKGGAIQLGKALNDPIAGISALSRVGVTFTEQQKEQIKAMVEAGNVADAQRVILAELAKEFGGSAAAQAQTLAGKLENLKKNLADTAEGMISSLLPAAEELFDNVIAPAVPTVLSLMDAIGGLGAALASGEIGDAGYAIFEIFSALFGKESGLQAEQFFYGIVDAGMAFAGFVSDNIPLVQSTFASVFGDISRVVTEVSSLFTQSLLPLITQIAGDTGAQLPTAQQVFESVMAAISTAVRVAADVLITYVIPAIAAVVAWVSENWPKIQAVISTVMEAVSTVIQDVLTWVQDFWAIWGDDIMGTLQGWANQMQIIFLAFSKAFEGDWKGFGETLRLAWDNAVDAILKLGESIGQWFSEQDWGKIGTDVIMGIADGVSRAGQWLMDTVMSIVKAAYEAALGFITGGAQASANTGGLNGQTGPQLTGPQLAGPQGYGGVNTSSQGGSTTIINQNLYITAAEKPDIPGEFRGAAATAASW